MTRVAQLLERARGMTSLDDFGNDDFRESLEILIKSAACEARFTAMGAAAFDAQIVDHLSNRLQVENWYRRHPEIDEQEIIVPLISTG